MPSISSLEVSHKQKNWTLSKLCFDGCLKFLECHIMIRSQNLSKYLEIAQMSKSFTRTNAKQSQQHIYCKHSPLSL